MSTRAPEINRWNHFVAKDANREIYTLFKIYLHTFFPMWRGYPWSLYPKCRFASPLQILHIKQEPNHPFKRQIDPNHLIDMIYTEKLAEVKTNLRPWGPREHAKLSEFQIELIQLASQLNGDHVLKKLWCRSTGSLSSPGCSTYLFSICWSKSHLILLPVSSFVFSVKGVMPKPNSF